MQGCREKVCEGCGEMGCRGMVYRGGGRFLLQMKLVDYLFF